MKKAKATGYAPVNGLNMYYESHGSGTTPLLLIHGGGSTIETSFGNILPFLDGFKVIAIELQAHGRTPDRDAPESFEQDADDAAALLKYLGIEKAHVMGFSNGGTTTLQLAARHPDIVNKIVVIAGAYKRDGFIPGFFEDMQSASIDNLPPIMKEKYIEIAGQAGLQVMFKRDKERMLNFKDYEDALLKGIKAPALFMVADNDVISVEHTLQMSRLAPGAQLAVLPGIHGAFMGEIYTVKPGSKMPGITAKMIEVFLNA